MAVLHDLLEHADVLLTSLRPGALERLGLGGDEVRAKYPSLVYARGHGYGVRGPDADQAGYDASAFFARGGLAHVLTPPERDYPISQPRRDGRPQRRRCALAFGIAGALLADAHRRGFAGRRVVARHRDVDACRQTSSPRSMAARSRGSAGAGRNRTRWSGPTGPRTVAM